MQTLTPYCCWLQQQGFNPLKKPYEHGRKARRLSENDTMVCKLHGSSQTACITIPYGRSDFPDADQSSMTITDRKRTLPLVMCSKASCALAKGNFSTMALTPKVRAKAMASSLSSA
jgi:hypothetical protein